MHTPSYVSFGNIDHQTKVGVDKGFFGGFVPLTHTRGDIDFFLRCQKGYSPYVFQIHFDRVVDADFVHDFLNHLVAQLFLVGCRYDFNTVLFEKSIDVFHFAGVHLDSVHTVQ